MGCIGGEEGAWSRAYSGTKARREPSYNKPNASLLISGAAIREIKAEGEAHLLINIAINPQLNNLKINN